jgi:hypothetical protein
MSEGTATQWREMFKICKQTFTVKNKKKNCERWHFIISELSCESP